MASTVCSYLRSSDPVNFMFMDILKRRLMKSSGVLWIGLYAFIAMAGAGAYQFRTRQQWITVSLPDPPAPLAVSAATPVRAHTISTETVLPRVKAAADDSGNLPLPNDSADSR